MEYYAAYYAKVLTAEVLRAEKIWMIANVNTSTP